MFYGWAEVGKLQLNSFLRNLNFTNLKYSFALSTRKMRFIEIVKIWSILIN